MIKSEISVKRLILKALIEDAPEFLHPYEDMDILDHPTDPPMPASLSIRLPDDGIDADPKDLEAHPWRMLESEAFKLEASRPYHLVGRVLRIPQTDIELRVAFFAEDGNRLGTATAP